MKNNANDGVRTDSTVTTNNTINLYGNVKGNVIAQNNGEASSNIVERNGKDEMLDEIVEAKKIISGISEINESQKQLLLNMMDDTYEAVVSKSDEKIKKSKDRFTSAICFLGNIGVKLIAALSGLANLSKFFGISPFQP